MLNTYTRIYHQLPNTNQHTKTGEQRTGSSQHLCTITDPNTAGYSEHIYCQHT